LEKGTDQRYGARHLKRAIERFLIHPLATLLATNQLRAGDLLIIDRQSQKECLAFAKHAEHQVAYPCVHQVDSNSLGRMNAEIRG
jgi:ATP-dependent Clp protease ATP-binding subunit ClpA